VVGPASLVYKGTIGSPPLAALPCPLPEDLGLVESQHVLQAEQVALVALIPPHRLTVRQRSCRLGRGPSLSPFAVYAYREYFARCGLTRPLPLATFNRGVERTGAPARAAGAAVIR
jgi:hypothetical protein